MDSIEERFAALQAQNLELQAIINKLQQQQQTVSGRTTPPSQLDMNISSKEVFKVAAKLPPFWQDRPATWFAQVESQFNIAGITTDQTKYDHVVAQLDSRIVGEVEDIVTQPPLRDKYLTLKAELIRRLSSSEEQRLRQLINEEELGDRRPSQFLRHLKSLAGTTLSDENILRQLWMRRLPQHLQSILAAQSELSLEKVAELADKILEVSPSTPAPRPPAGNVYSTEDISNRLDELARQVAALTTNRRGRSRSRPRASSSSEGKSLCWYHRNFKEKATKCTSPCSWKQAENQKGCQ